MYFHFGAFVHVAYSKVFSTTKWFSQKFYGSFGIGLFVSSNTCKGKAAYTRISSDLAKAGSHWVMLLLLLYSYLDVGANIGRVKIRYTHIHVLPKNCYSIHIQPIVFDALMSITHIGITYMGLIHMGYTHIYPYIYYFLPNTNNYK